MQVGSISAAANLCFVHIRVIPGFLGAAAGWVLLVLAVFSLAFLAERILFGMAAYHDALSKGNPDAVMWGLLIGFLGLIPGIIYLCVRGSSGRMVCCRKCGFWHRAVDPVCPMCGEPNPAAQAMPLYSGMYASRAKKELVAAVICIAAAVVVSVVGTIILVANAAFLFF